MSREFATVLVIGGTGHFGARICRRLVTEPGARLVVSSRSAESAARFAATLGGMPSSSSVISAALDHHSDAFEAELAALEPDVVIHTAGPFQGQDYRVAKACVRCGSHYIDLADGRRFVAGFGSNLDTEARAAGVLLVTGASTLPGLSSAVVRELTDGWRQVDAIEIVIAPAQQTPRGVATIAAVLSYCGKSFKVLNDGRWEDRYGWQSLKPMRYWQLGTRLSAVCDVPDLELFPLRDSKLKTVVFRAALESKLEHLVLWVFATLVRMGVVADWAPFAKSFQGLSRLSRRLGSDLGGMRVEVRGLDGSGTPQRREWSLVARQNHGPEIPVSPALILARKLIRGALPLRGAYPCVDLISVQDFREEVSSLDIAWRTETEVAEQ